MTRLRVVLTLLAVMTTIPPALLGQSCGDNDPATPVPECRNQNNGNQVPCSDPNAVRLWPAGLRPGLPGQTLPPERDSTQWTSTTIPGAFSGHELFHGLDILGNKLYVAYNAGFQIWDIASGPHAEQPSRELTKDGWRGDFLDFPSFGENDFYVDDIDVVTAGGKNLIALSGRVTVGLSVWEHTIAPLGLVQKYQDLGNRSQRVRVVNQGGINYAFAGGQLGIFVYDLNQAQALASSCLDVSGTVCPGVYRGKLGETNLSLFLDTIKRDGRVYVAKSGGNGVPVEIWEVTTPSSPGTAVRRFQSAASSGSQGVAFFEINTIPYLGVVEKVGSAWRLRVYNVDACLDTNGCGTLGTPLVNRALDVSASTPQFLNFSSSGSTPFLYYGANEFGLEGSQVEQLLDLSNFPGSVSEVTEGGGTYHDTCNGETVDYWGDYYPHNDKGLRNIRPMVGKFKGNYFYRAAFGVLDVHVLEAQEPTIVLSGPSEGFPGDPQAFQASASGCTPNPTYNWTASGGGSVPGSGANVNITWSTPGTKTVTVTNSGCPGAQGQRTIDIQDPAAMVGTVSMVPASPRVCDQVLFTANNVTGQPPIADAWTVTRNSDSMVVASGAGSNHTFPWNTATSPNPIPGGYTAQITVSNGAGSDSAQRTFTLAAASLSFDDGPTYEGAPGPRGAGTSVQFFAGAAGDSAWSWDFDDSGSGSNTSSLENPTHTFATPGTYDVTLQISSCDAGVAPISDTVTIEIVDNPLEITSFTANCLFGVCEFCAGAPVAFFIEYEGDPETFSYDWDGDGDFDQNSPNPINTHTYPALLANFFPRARISAVGQDDIFTHPQAVNVVNCGPPPTAIITVSGPTTREVGQAGSYSGSAINCSPAASGWSWSASGGGVVTGSTNSSQVSITWATGGTKTVTASNSSCGTATGNLNVSVTGPSIAIAGPTSRLVDQPGDFNASAENCSPVANGWHWNATGGGNITGNTSSNAVTVTWSSAGTKTLTATNDGCSGAQGTRSVSVSASGGGVNAAFTYSPEDPGAGQPVTFNASSSTGNIGSYFWSFGDGTPSASGPMVTHTFGEEGSYNVFLTVAESGCANPQCEDSANHNVVVGGDGPPLSTDEMLILPYFVVDTFAAPGAGLTTFFAIRNETDSPLTVRTDYFGAADTEPFHSDQGTLDPHSAAPINIRVISGLPFDEETGLSEGYVQASVIGLEGGVRTISGDIFYVDAPNDFASGGNMLTPAVPDLCSEWSMRFFNGGGFDGGTEIQFYAPGNPGDGVVIVGDVYDETGGFMTRLEIDNPAIAFSMTDEELELPVNFGGIEWQFQGGIQGHVAYVLKALGRFSVGGPAICRDDGF